MSPHLRTTILLGALALAPQLRAQATQPAPTRGAWFWQSPTSTFGSAQVVGDPQREDATIALLKRSGITTLYGSYRGDGTLSPTTLRAWNAKLAHNGIASYLLLSDTELFLPEARTAADARIHDGFLIFNATAQPEERFQGLAFDIEPHILPSTTRNDGWKTASALQRRQYLGHLLAFYQHVRDTIGPAAIEVTLPVWFSHLNGSIAWTGSADRDAWFHQLATTCDRVSLMAFELDSAEKVLAHTQDERTLLQGRARIALRANLGSEWKTTADLWQAARRTESATGSSIDLQDVALLAAEESTHKSSH